MLESRNCHYYHPPIHWPDQSWERAANKNPIPVNMAAVMMVNRMVTKESMSAKATNNVAPESLADTKETMESRHFRHQENILAMMASKRGTRVNKLEK